MRASTFVADTNALASDMNNLRSDAYGSSQIQAHQETTPGLTVYVEPGVFYLGPSKVTFAGGSTAAITAPTANPRIDLVTIDSSGTLAVVTGTEAATPTAPTYDATKMVVAEIYNPVGETVIYDNENQVAGQGYLTDVRPFISNPPTAPANTGNALTTIYQNTSGRPEMHMVTFALTAGNSSAVGTARVSINCDSASNPATVVAEAEAQTTSPSTNEIYIEQQLVFIVPPGYYYQAYPYTNGSGTVGTNAVAWLKFTL